MDNPTNKDLDQILQNVALLNDSKTFYVSKEEAAQRLKEILSHCPVLHQQMSEAVQNDYLKQIQISGKTGASVHYDAKGKTIQLGDFQLKYEKEGNVIFILSHETQHGPNQEAETTANDTFMANIKNDIASQGNQRDYTTSMENMIDAMRENEVIAHITGWNTLNKYIRSRNEPITLQNIYNTAPNYAPHFMKRIESSDPLKDYDYTLKVGITLNEDLTMSATPQNIDAVGKHYFDVPAKDMPEKELFEGNSDYRNLYSAPYISAICRQELANPKKGGKAMLDFEQLGLDPEQLRRVGIDLGKFAGQRCELYDTKHPDTPITFEHSTRPKPEEPDKAAQPLSMIPDVLYQGVPLADKVAEWHEALETHLGPKLVERGFSQQEKENCFAGCMLSMIEKGQSRIQFAGIDDKLGLIALATEDNYRCPAVSLAESREQTPEQTFGQMAQAIERQNNPPQQGKDMGGPSMG